MTNGKEASSGLALGFEHLVGVLLRPGATWASLAARPTFGLLLALNIFFGVAAGYLTALKIDPVEVIATLARSNPEAANVIQPEAIARSMPITTALGALVMIPAWTLLSAAIFLGISRLLGGAIDYRRSLAVTIHGYLPFLLSSVAVLFLLPAYDVVPPRALNESLLVPTHLGVFVGEDSPGPVRALASSADLLSIWSIGLLSQGLASVGKLPFRRALWGVGLVWVLGVLVKAGLASLGSAAG